MELTLKNNQQVKVRPFHDDDFTAIQQLNHAEGYAEVDSTWFHKKTSSKTSP